MRKIESPLFNLESRLVFTKCNPFKLAVEGRQLIFGKAPFNSKNMINSDSADNFKVEI